MAQNGHPQNRAYSPYAVDSPVVPPRDSSSFKPGVYQNNAYSNLGYTQSQEDVSKLRPSSTKGNYLNPTYENSELSHQYEDPTHLVARSAASTGPRRKRNELYEPTEINKGQETNDDVVSESVAGGDSWLSRLILFLILMVSLTSLILVALIIIGKVGPVCSSCNEEEVATAPSGQQLSGSQTTVKPGSVVVSPPDVSSLENKINELKANLSWIKAIMNNLQQDIQGTKGDLTNTNRDINGTNDKLLQIQSGTQDSIEKIQNISQRLDASVSALNISFFGELSKVKTSFDSKLNSTAQNLLKADNSLQTLLNTINSSLSAQVQSISKSQGPTGPPGFNGSKGVTGPQGPLGLQGDQGNQGVKGDPGVKGDRGFNGTDGAAGLKGDTGPQGDKGDLGPPGPKGSKGETGPRGAQGAGNFSQCSYKEYQGTTVTVSPDATADADVSETAVSHFISFTISSTFTICKLCGVEDYE
ncbi:uncharacterized protein [Porites lutea]|uniref:uncharacterized protein isoform X3 n=1 Tax=Porites lutea TaxID=51062 RepID=UPI003CC69554